MNVDTFREEYSPEKLVALSDQDKLKMFDWTEESNLPYLLERTFNEFGSTKQSSFGIAKYKGNVWKVHHNGKESLSEQEALKKINNIFDKLNIVNKLILNDQIEQIEDNMIVDKMLFYKFFVLFYPNKFVGIYKKEILNYIYEDKFNKRSNKNWFIKSAELALHFEYTNENFYRQTFELWKKYNPIYVNEIPPKSEHNYVVGIMNKKLIKEACVETIAEINNAIEHQADQLELCSRLNVGGFTPSDALISYALSRNSKTIIMIRNRDDFKTSWWNNLKLKKVIKKYVHSNVQGFVFGFLKRGDIDQKAVKTLLRAVGNKETIFHMAFDELLDPQKGIDTLVKLGVTRILTKGGKKPAMENLSKLKSLYEYADGRIQLIVGGSVTDENYQIIAQATGIKYFHGRKLAYSSLNCPTIINIS